MTAALVLVLARSAVFVVFEQAHFDSDQAIFGLMAKHLTEGRALPVFSYGEYYMLGVEAWLAAPLFLIAGPSVTMLKLPLLVMNLVIALLLIRLFERQAGLRPAVAFVAALPFVLASPGTATYLLEAAGGNVEPFLWVLLLWVLRRRPAAFGAVFAIGFLNREFTAYGLAALLLVEAADGSLFRRSRLRDGLVATIAFTAVWQTIRLLEAWSSAYGPGTSLETYPPPAQSALLGHMCLDPAVVPAALWRLFTVQPGELLGALRRPVFWFGANTTVLQGLDGLWVVIGGAMLLGLGRIGWLVLTGRARPWRGRPQVTVFLFLIGLQAAVVHAIARCGEVDLGTMRYSLLAVLGACGLAACFLQVERSRRLRGLAVAVVSGLALVSAIDHARLADEYVRRPPPSIRRALADYLVSHDIRFGYADFWDAYSVSFLAGERVILASTSVTRIMEYEWRVAARRDEAVRISREPCPGGAEVAGFYYVCDP